MAIIRSTGIVFTDSVPTHTPIGNDSTLVFNVSNHKFYEYVGSTWIEYNIETQNIYNINGTLPNDRVVSLNGHDLILYNGRLALASEDNLIYPLYLSTAQDAIGLDVHSDVYNTTWTISNEEGALIYKRHIYGSIGQLDFNLGEEDRVWQLPIRDGVIALTDDIIKTTTIFLFQRAGTAPTAPSGTISYNFLSKNLSGTLGSWTREVPINDGNPLYVITGYFSGSSDNASISNSEWSQVRVLATNGTDGVDGIDGINGTNGTNGANGTNGDEVQIRVDSGYIQWKYSQIPTWTNLVALLDLKGDDGEFDIHNAPSKTTPVNADELGVADSESTFSLKKVTWSNIKATLKTFFDSLYVGIGAALPSGGTEDQVLTKRTGADYDFYWETPAYNNFAFTVVDKNSSFVVDETGHAYIISGSGISATINTTSSGVNGGLILLSNIDPSNAVTITTVGVTILGTPLGSLAAGKSIMYMQTALNTFVQIATY